MPPSSSVLRFPTSLFAASGKYPALLIVLFLAAQPTVVAAQPRGSVLEDPEVRRLAKEGLDLLYNMQFDEATVRFESISSQYPDHPIGPFLEALNLWWEILMDLSDTRHDAAFYEVMDEVVDRCDRRLKSNDEDFDAMFFKGIALGFKGRLRSNRSDWIRAAANGKRAMDYVLAVSRADSTNNDFLLGPGLYNYYAALIPERYPFVRAITTFLPKGDKERGIAQIQRTIRDGYFLRTEAAYFLLMIHFQYEGNYRATVQLAELLRSWHPGNSYFHTLEGRVHARWSAWTRSDTIFMDALDKFRGGVQGYNAASAEQALYFLARGRMIRGALAEALGYLLSLEALTARREEDTFFKVLGRFQQGRVYDMLGQRKRAVERYHEVLDMKEWSGTHDLSRRHLRRPYGSR